MRKGDCIPSLYAGILYRSKDQIQIFEGELVNDAKSHVSDPIPCGAFKHFTLYLNIDSTSTPTTLQIEVQFLERWSSKWHIYKQGLFASLFYEDVDTASGIQEVFDGDCAGREFRLKLTGVDTTSLAYFTVTASVEFRN